MHSGEPAYVTEFRKWADEGFKNAVEQWINDPTTDDLKKIIQQRQLVFRAILDVIERYRAANVRQLKQVIMGYSENNGKPMISLSAVFAMGHKVSDATYPARLTYNLDDLAAGF